MAGGGRLNMQEGYGHHRDDLSAEMWNDPSFREGQKVGWTAPVCDDCWVEERGDRTPVRIRPPGAEVCSNCGVATRSGIFTRVAPDKQVFKAWEWIGS